MHDKIVDRVKKLIALALGTHSQEEARTAAKMAVDLIAQHGLLDRPQVRAPPPPPPPAWNGPIDCKPWTKCEQAGRLMEIAIRAGIAPKHIVLVALACARMALQHTKAIDPSHHRLVLRISEWCSDEATVEQVRSANRACINIAEIYRVFGPMNESHAYNICSLASQTVTWSIWYAMNVIEETAKLVDSTKDSTSGHRRMVQLIREYISTEAILIALRTEPEARILTSNPAQ